MRYWCSGVLEGCVNGVKEQVKEGCGTEYRVCDCSTTNLRSTPSKSVIPLQWDVWGGDEQNRGEKTRIYYNRGSSSASWQRGITSRAHHPKALGAVSPVNFSIASFRLPRELGPKRARENGQALEIWSGLGVWDDR